MIPFLPGCGISSFSYNQIHEVQLPIITIRDPNADDEAQWKALWAGYTRFFDTDLPDDITQLTWQRILDPGSSIEARVADVDGTLVGFAVLVLHAGTWTRQPICYLEDLFVDSAHRGDGVGHRLLQDVVELANKKQWARLYWHTKTDNAAARHLYDRFVEADTFVRYRLVFGPEQP